MKRKPYVDGEVIEFQPTPGARWRHGVYMFAGTRRGQHYVLRHPDGTYQVPARRLRRPARYKNRTEVFRAVLSRALAESRHSVHCPASAPSYGGCTCWQREAEKLLHGRAS